MPELANILTMLLASSRQTIVWIRGDLQKVHVVANVFSGPFHLSVTQGAIPLFFSELGNVSFGAARKRPGQS